MRQSMLQRYYLQKKLKTHARDRPAQYEFGSIGNEITRATDFQIFSHNVYNNRVKAFAMCVCGKPKKILIHVHIIYTRQIYSQFTHTSDVHALKLLILQQSQTHDAFQYIWESACKYIFECVYVCVYRLIYLCVRACVSEFVLVCVDITCTPFVSIYDI